MTATNSFMVFQYTFHVIILHVLHICLTFEMFGVISTKFNPESVIAAGRKIMQSYEQF